MHLLDLRLIEIYQKYLMPDLEHEILEKCRQKEWISEVDEQDMLKCLQQLDFFGVLKENLLSSWCSQLPELMAAPLRDWLRITRDVGVVACPKVAACVASEFFLKQREDMLLLLAELNLLDLLEECASWSWLEEAQLYQLFTEDILMPLTQLSTFRQELRHPRFRQPSLALLLQPFPRLRDDLLDAWFEVPQETKISPEDLAQWASTPAAMPRDLLRRKWQTLTKADFQKFVSLAPDHIFSEDFREDCLVRWHQEEVLPCAPEAEEIYRLWRFQLASSHQLLLWLLCLIWRPCGCPKRIAEKGHHFWRKRKRKHLSVMECWKVLLGLVLEETHCWLVALQAVIAMDVFLLKVLWHFLRRAFLEPDCFRTV